MGLFSCTHPFDRLLVAKGHTTKQVDEDFNHVTYHFQCMKCHAYVDKTYAEMRGGVDAFLSRLPKLSDFPKWKENPFYGGRINPQVADPMGDAMRRLNPML